MKITLQQRKNEELEVIILYPELTQQVKEIVSYLRTKDICLYQGSSVSSREEADTIGEGACVLWFCISEQDMPFESESFEIRRDHFQ